MIKIIQTGPFQVNSLLVDLSGPDFVSGDKIFITDPADCDFSLDSNSILNFVEEKKLEIAFVLLTHGHFDHVSGLKSIKKQFPEVPVLIHLKDGDFLGEKGNYTQKLSLEMMGFEEFLPFVTDLPCADGFLEEGENLFSALKKGNALCKNRVKLFGEKEEAALSDWRVLHTPGHTEGSVCIYNEKQRSLIAGDTVFYHSLGRTDLPGGSEGAIQKSLKRLYHELSSNTLVYSGHEYCGFTLGENL